MLDRRTVDDVIVNPQLSAEQKNQVKDLLVEYNEIFSDVPKVTHLIEHKVELTESEPVKRKPYPIPYKMQEVIDKEKRTCWQWESLNALKHHTRHHWC